VIFRAIIPLLCRNHLPADFGKPLLHVFAHFSSLLPPCYQHDGEHAVNLGNLMLPLGEAAFRDLRLPPCCDANDTNAARRVRCCHRAGLQCDFCGRLSPIARGRVEVRRWL
jgi:hypothetical protein